jgi:integrase
VAGFTGLLSATSRRSLDEARREDVEAWIGALLARWKPATARNRYRGLHAFYRWLEDEEDIPSPMAKLLRSDSHRPGPPSRSVVHHLTLS